MKNLEKIAHSASQLTEERVFRSFLAAQECLDKACDEFTKAVKELYGDVPSRRDSEDFATKVSYAAHIIEKHFGSYCYLNLCINHEED